MVGRRGRGTVLVVAGVLLVMLTAGCGGGDGTVESRPASAANGGDEPRSSDGDPGGGPVTGVAGLVVSAAGGRPVPGALVTPVSRDDPAAAIPEIAVQTDDEGRYRWALPPGSYDVTVTADGHRPATEQVVVTEGAVAPLDFTLEPSP